MPRAWRGSSNLGCLDLNPHPVRAEDLDHPDELRVDLDPMPGVDWSQIVDVAYRRAGGARRRRTRGLAEDERFARAAHPGAHRAAVGLPRRAARRRDPRPRGREPRARASPPRGGGRRSAARASSSTSTRTPRTARWHPRTRSGRCPTPGSRRRSTGTRCAPRRPEEFTVPTVLERFAERGRPARRHRRRGRLARRAARAWPPSSAPPRSRRAAATAPAAGSRQMPLIEVARTKTKPEALGGARAVEGPASGRRPALHPADVLVDGMRGSSSLWYRVRVNLQHVPEAERPAQEALHRRLRPVGRRPLGQQALKLARTSPGSGAFVR